MVIRYFHMLIKERHPLIRPAERRRKCSLKINYPELKGDGISTILSTDWRQTWVYILFDSLLLKDSMSSGIQFDFFPHIKFYSGVNPIPAIHWKNALRKLIQLMLNLHPLYDWKRSILVPQNTIIWWGNWLIKTTRGFCWDTRFSNPCWQLPNNRLGLVKWLTTDDHLTARTMVNRL